MHAPEVTEALKREIQKLDEISDEVDKVNILKLRAAAAAAEAATFDEQNKFDEEKKKEEFRNYEDACDRVKMFYAEQHKKQTLSYNLSIRQKFKTPRTKMSIWQAIETLNTLIDNSDPDTSLTQIEHLLQTAEAIRRDNKPDWMILTGLIHDLGKLLCFFGADGQWDVVGDTFVVGCRYSDKIIYHDTFIDNPDFKDERLMTENGIYEVGCGLDNVLLSWGHDEYLYNVCKNQSKLPKEALSMIRYHSFYPWHRENAYQHLMNESDKEQLRAVRAFNPYDLYSKSDDPPNVEELKPYYLELIAKYFPEEIDW